MLLLKQSLLGIVLPALVAFAVLIVAWCPWRRKDSPPVGRWGGALALSAGYAVGHVALTGWQPFPPTEVTHWLLYFALAAMAVGLLDALWREPAWLRWGGRLLLAGAVVWLLLRPIIEYTWGSAQGAAWIVGLGLALLAFWAGLEALSERLSTASLSLILLIVTAGSSVVLLLSGSALLSQLGGAAAATLGACLVVAGRSPTLSLARGAVCVVSVLLAGLWLNGYFYAEAPLTSVLLVALSPTAAWVGQVERVRRLAPWQANLVRVAVVLVPVALAVVTALRASPRTGYG